MANSFDVLKEMSEKNMDIALSKNILNAQKVKAGGHIKIGVDDATCSKIMGYIMGENNYQVALLVFNINEFKEISNKLDNQP